jgi:RecB family exonuclease
LASLGDIVGYCEPPHYSKFSVLDQDTRIVLRGTPDGILAMRDGSFVIIDYKTAKFSAHQDELFPMYATQLNAYAVIGEQCGFRPVSGLVLIYTEPATDDAAAAMDRNLTGAGFAMEFTTHILAVELARHTIPELLAKVREIYDRERAPESHPGCVDCTLLQNLIKMALE